MKLLIKLVQRKKKKKIQQSGEPKEQWVVGVGMGGGGWVWCGRTETKNSIEVIGRTERKGASTQRSIVQSTKTERAEHAEAGKDKIPPF